MTQLTVGPIKRSLFVSLCSNEFHVSITVSQQVPSSDPVVLVRSLDKLYRQVIVVTSDDVCESLVSKIALSVIEMYHRQRQEHFNTLLEQTYSTLSKHEREPGKLPPLAAIYTSLHDEFRSSFKADLIALKEFISSSIKFSQNRYFRQQFCTVGIREVLVKKVTNMHNPVYPNGILWTVTGSSECY